MFVSSCWLLPFLYFHLFESTLFFLFSSCPHSSFSILSSALGLWLLPCAAVCLRSCLPSTSEVLLVPAELLIAGALSVCLSGHADDAQADELQHRPVLPLRGLRPPWSSADLLPGRAAEVLAAISLQDSGGCSSTLHTIIKHD